MGEGGATQKCRSWGSSLVAQSSDNDPTRAASWAQCHLVEADALLLVLLFMVMPFPEVGAVNPVSTSARCHLW